MEGKIGFEPTFEGFADPAVASPAHFPKLGSGRWIRTTDTQIQSLMFYQLNYSGMATSTGLEPATSSVTGWHSNQLSYEAIMVAEDGIAPPAFWV